LRNPDQRRRRDEANDAYGDDAQADSEGEGFHDAPLSS
jgi:hypothetical protein